MPEILANQIFAKNPRDKRKSLEGSALSRGRFCVSTINTQRAATFLGLGHFLEIIFLDISELAPYIDF